MRPTRWRCLPCDATGRLDDDSAQAHVDAAHAGSLEALGMVQVWPDPPAPTMSHLVTVVPPRDHSVCPLPVLPGSNVALWRCPVCTVPWQHDQAGWYVAEWTYAGPRQPVRVDG